MNNLDFAKLLREKNSQLNQGHGIQTIRYIYEYIEEGNLDYAKEICFNDGDKIPKDILFLLEKQFNIELTWETISKKYDKYGNRKVN